jgi:hypothetical protein
MADSAPQLGRILAQPLGARAPAALRPCSTRPIKELGGAHKVLCTASRLLLNSDGCRAQILGLGHFSVMRSLGGLAGLCGSGPCAIRHCRHLHYIAGAAAAPGTRCQGRRLSEKSVFGRFYGYGRVSVAAAQLHCLFAERATSGLAEVGCYSTQRRVPSENCCDPGFSLKLHVPCRFVLLSIDFSPDELLADDGTHSERPVTFLTCPELSNRCGHGAGSISVLLTAQVLNCCTCRRPGCTFTCTTFLRF